MVETASRGASPSCSFLTGGDVAPDRPSGRNLFGKLAPLFRNADLAFLNLEHNLATSGELMKGKPTHHRGRPELIEGFHEAGFDALTIANNHMLDFGLESFFDTLDLLTAHSFPFTGAGRNLAEARKPVILERNGLSIGILAYSTTLPQGSAAGPNEPGVNPMRVSTSYKTRWNPSEYPGSEMAIHTTTEPADLARMKREISSLKKKVDVVLVGNHWGASMSHAVHDYQREIGRAAIDAGASAIFGGHQHVLSGIEFHKGKPIVHCTGNLIFDIVEPFFSDATHQTFLFGGTLTKKGIDDIYIRPCRCGVGKAPELLSRWRGDGRDIVWFMEKLCKPFGTRLDVRGDRVMVIPPNA